MSRLAVVLLVTCLSSIGVAGSVAAQSPEPPPYPEGTGVTFEPIGPSVWRVIEPEPDCEHLPPLSRLEIAPDGRAWYLDKRGVWELGACPILGHYPNDFTARAHALAPDGTLWVLDRDRLMSWEGEDWIIHAEGTFNVMECDADGDGPDTPEGVDEYGGQCSTSCEEHDCYGKLDVAPDGTVWLSGGYVVTAFDGETWTQYPEAWWVLGFGPDGVVWAEATDNGELLVIRP